MRALTWFKGLAAAIISAVASSILSSGFASASGSPLNWTQIGSIAGSSALVGACLYLKQSPIPDDSSSTPQTLQPGPIRAQDLQDK